MIKSLAGQLEVAQRHIEAGRLDDAVALLESLLNKGAPAPSVAPLLYRAYLMRSRARLAAGRFDESLADVQQALKLRPDQREGYDLLLQVQAARAALPELADTLQRQLAGDPKNAALRLILAKAYEQLGWYPEARSAAMLARDQKPTLAEAHHLLRRVEKKLEGAPAQYREAAGRREAAGDINGAMVMLFKWADATASAAHYLEVAAWCEQAGRQVGAVNAYKHALILDPTALRAQVGLWRLEDKQKALPEARLKQLYDGFMRLGDLPGAADFLAQYTTRHPTFSPALLLLSRAYQALGNLDAAAANLQAAIATSRLSPDWPALYYELGLLHEKRGHPEEAYQAYEQALRFAPGYHEASERLDKVMPHGIPPEYRLRQKWEEGFRPNGRYWEAVEYYKGLTAQDGNEYAPFIYLGYAYAALDELDLGYEAAKHAALLRHTAESFIKLGDFCLSEGLTERAEEAYRWALTEEPRNSTALSRLGSMRQRGDDPDKLKDRDKLPRFAYLEALSRVLANRGQEQALAKYYTVQADVMRGDSGVFRLLGAAQAAADDMRAAAAAYLHQADLVGTAHQYAWAADFCYREGFDEWAREAYWAALLLNPFHRHARSRLAQLGEHDRALPPPRLQSEGHEEQARNLCETLRRLTQAEAFGADTAKLHGRLQADAARLRKTLMAQPAEPRVVKSVEAVYRDLQRLYPAHACLRRDLAQVYLAWGHAAQAWREAYTALHEGGLDRDARAELEGIASLASARLAQRGEARPEAPARVQPSLHDAYLIMMEWTGQDSDPGVGASLNGAGGDLARQAGAEVAEALARPVADGGAQRRWLAAATLYQKAGRVSDMLTCLVRYGEARAQTYQAAQPQKAAEWLRQAVELAISDAAPSDRRTALAVYGLGYLQHQAARYGPPTTWGGDVVAAWRAVAQVVGELEPPLQRWLHLLDEVLAALRSPKADRSFQGPWHRAAAFDRETRVVLPASAQPLVTEALAPWLTNTSLPATITPSRTQLRLIVPDRLDSPLTPAGATQGDVTLTIRNEGQVPADAVRVSLWAIGASAASRAAASDFIAFIPGGGQATVTFHVPLPAQLVEYMELGSSVTYFDPVDRQQAEVQAVLTLRRAGEASRSITDPYAQPWPPKAPFKPVYGDPESLRRDLVRQGREGGINWTPGAVDQAIELAGREELALWALASPVVERLQGVERTVVLGLDVAAAAEAMTQDQGCPPFQALLRDNDLDASMGLVLACLASGRDNRWITRDTLRQSLAASGHPMTITALSHCISESEDRLRLLEMEMVAGQMRYCFRSELLRRWLNTHWTPLQASQRLQQVQREERSGRLPVVREHIGRALNWHHSALEARHSDGDPDETGRAAAHEEKRDRALAEGRATAQPLLKPEELMLADTLFDTIQRSSMDEDIRVGLRDQARQQGWSEVEIQTRLSRVAGPLEEQIARSILNVWDVWRGDGQRPVDSVVLADALNEQFNLDEIEDLCYRLRVETENLKGGTRQAKAWALVQHCVRHGRVDELKARVLALRPRLQL